MDLLKEQLVLLTIEEYLQSPSSFDTGCLESFLIVRMTVLYSSKKIGSILLDMYL